MRNSIILSMMILSGIMFSGCSGAAEKEKPGSKTPALVSNSNMPAANTNALENRKDADDLLKESRPVNNAANQATNQKHEDADDIRGNSRTNSKVVSNRQDPDDRNKRDNDRDDDDH